jgi:LPS sulfotransferase NodH
MTQRGLGAPTEHFQFPEAPILDGPLSDHLVELVEQWPGDYFGLKVAWQQAYELTSRLRQEDDPDVSLDLRTVFPGLAYVHIVRRDKIAQAVSSWRAVSSGTWHWPVGAKVDRGHPGYDFETIKAHLLQMIAEDWLWKSHFEERAIAPFVVTYEDYLEDRDGHLQRIADFLGAPRSTQRLEERIQVMRDDWTDQITEFVKADLEAPRQPYWVLPPGPEKEAQDGPEEPSPPA